MNFAERNYPTNLIRAIIISRSNLSDVLATFSFSFSFHLFVQLPPFPVKLAYQGELKAAFLLHLLKDDIYLIA